MNKIMKSSIFIFLITFSCMSFWNSCWALSPISKEPYRAALLLDANTGKILFQHHAESPCYPASVLKLMTLYVILEHIKTGDVLLSDIVQITKEAAQMGGSQVFLDPKEQFSIEELLYALMIQSANDAAVALATHVAGSPEAFVREMNQKAEALGMTQSKFYSVHGLPPGKGQQVDITTARDLALLARALVKNPQTFPFTSTLKRDFRDGKFIMRTHNHLLEDVRGCDGLKTGFFRAAGFSIVATAQRDGKRVIAIVLNSANRKERDAAAARFLEEGFASLDVAADSKAKVVQKINNTAVEIIEESNGQTLPQPLSEGNSPQKEGEAGFDIASFFFGITCGIILMIVLFIWNKRKKQPRYRYGK